LYSQSIGRAIRHREDYAVLILADARYSRPGSKSSLPDWIARELAVCQKFGPSVALVRKVIKKLLTINLTFCGSKHLHFLATVIILVSYGTSKIIKCGNKIKGGLNCVLLNVRQSKSRSK